jgi:hypothetical protein
MEPKTIGRAIGTASLGFGITDIMLGKTFGRSIGAGEAVGGTLFGSVGAREIVTGLIGLAFPTSSVPVWTRFAADLTDLAALAPLVAKSNPKRAMATTAIAIVAAVALVDFVAARTMDQRADR